MPSLNDLLTRVRDALDEPVPAQFSDEMLTRWLNEANQDLARTTRMFKDSTTFDVIVDNPTYPLPAETIGVEQIYLHESGGRVVDLVPQHFEDFDALRNGYGAVFLGQPTYYSTFGFPPNLFLLIFPVPTGPGTIEMFGSRLPAPMDLNTPDAMVDTLEIWDDALIDYAEYKALRRDRDPRWQEAYALYKEKRDDLIDNPDYLPVSRGVVPTPGGGWLPEWLTSFG